MENLQEITNSAEQYESFLSVRMTDVTKEDLKKEGAFVFAVTPEFKIFISKTSHEFLARYGVSLGDTLAQGYLNVDENGKPDIDFKIDAYQPYRNFYGTDEEFAMFKDGISHKIQNFIAE